MWSPEPEQRRGTCRWDLLLYTQAVEDKDKSWVTVRLDLLLHETRACFFSQHWPRGGWWQQPPEHQDSAADLQPRGWRPPSRWRCRAFQVPCPSAAARWTIHGCVHVRHRIGGGSEPFYIQVQYLENDYDVWWELSSTVVVVSVSQSVRFTHRMLMATAQPEVINMIWLLMSYSPSVILWMADHTSMAVRAQMETTDDNMPKISVEIRPSERYKFIHVSN